MALLAGAVVGSAFRLVEGGRAGAMPVLIAFYAATIFSPIWSLFRYNSLVMPVVFLALYFAARGWFVASRLRAPHHGTTAPTTARAVA